MSSKLPGNTLSYFPPDPGRSISVRIPESHCLFIGPPACGRRHSIYAMEAGDAEQISFLFMEEADAVVGKYEQIIGDAVEELLCMLKPPPRALLLYFNCVDDFLGTDEGALLSILQARFPNVPIRCTRIDPIALGKKIMPGMLIQSRLYSFLAPNPVKDAGVNIICPDCFLKDTDELVVVLQNWGLQPIRQLAFCKTFDEFQQMAQSRLNLVLSFVMELAAQNMEAALGIPYLCVPSIGPPEQYAAFYRQLALQLGQPVPDCSTQVLQARQDLEQTCKCLDGMPIVVDDSVSVNAIDLAALLLDSGFCVTRILITEIRERDRETADWIRKNHPETAIERSRSYALLADGKDKESSREDLSGLLAARPAFCVSRKISICGPAHKKECLVLGIDGAYLLKADYWVDMCYEDDYFGFSGMHRLLESMRYGASHARPLDRRI